MKMRFNGFENSTLEGLYPSEDDFAKAFTEIDSGTAAALYRSFYWRVVCDDKMFAPYLHSLYQRIGQQYEDLLRVQLTRIDPMVTKYLERELQHGGADITERSGSTEYGASEKTTHDTTDTLEHGHTVTTEHDTIDSETHGLKIVNNDDSKIDKTYGHTTSDSGTEVTETKNNQTQTTTNTDTIAKRHTENSGTSRGTGQSDSRGLSATLPHVQAYTGGGGFPVAVTVQQPGGTSQVQGQTVGAMDWTLADSQSETASANSTQGSTSASTDVSVDGNDVSVSKVGYDGEADTSTRRPDLLTTEGGTDSEQHSGGNTETHSGTDSTTHTGSDTEKNSGQDVTTRTGSDTVQHSGIDSTSGKDTTSYGSYDRERYTGHDGNPADLLKAARDYISGTGAFSWLCRRVDTCFLDMYDY